MQSCSYFRHLASDTDNGMHQLVTNLMRRMGVMEEQEIFNAETLKTKIIFITAQFVYTVISIIPVPLLFSSYYCSVVYISAIYGWTVWRGSNFYYEDFLDRYNILPRRIKQQWRYFVNIVGSFLLLKLSSIMEINDMVVYIQTWNKLQACKRCLRTIFERIVDFFG